MVAAVCVYLQFLTDLPVAMSAVCVYLQPVEDLPVAMSPSHTGLPVSSPCCRWAAASPRASGYSDCATDAILSHGTIMGVHAQSHGPQCTCALVISPNSLRDRSAVCSTSLYRHHVRPCEVAGRVPVWPHCFLGQGYHVGYM